MSGAQVPHVIALVITIASIQLCSALYRCDGTPTIPGLVREQPNKHFMLKISGEPHMYTPGEKYSVTVMGSQLNQSPEKFTGFALIVEASASSLVQPNSVGSFQLYGDALTMFSDNCPNMVMQASTALRSEVNVHWTAPQSGSGCVTFRATVVERDTYFMNDGLLSRTICEDVQDNSDEQPQVLEKCCACDEAKYEVTFEGLWSRHTHPKDFPPNSWMTRFSDVIGASHTENYMFWEYGGIASEGLREVAEKGRTRMLESELKAESEHIRTIIKARGISYPNVTGKTFAVFRVDRKHHLMSLVSMIVPSPDWIVGVSGLELCLTNCSWLEFKVLNLKPWDVGTDSGTTYTSPDSPTPVREPIHRITTKYPADESNPFYDPTGEDIKPFAKLIITRQRLYEKSCSDDSISAGEDDDPTSDCAVDQWQPYSECSVTCGNGYQKRQRFYVNQQRADLAGCNRNLTMRMPCFPGRCSGDTSYPNIDDFPLKDDPRCALEDWDRWSSCSATCGKAVRTQGRRYIMQGAMKLCGGYPRSPELQRTMICNLDDCEGEDQTEEDENCSTNWLEWTACSVTCGQGIKTRSSYHKESDPPNCPYTKKTEQVTCFGKLESCVLTPENSKRICMQPKDEGVCSSNLERWYFDSGTATCLGFKFGGCKGNGNNFVTKGECETACSSLIDPINKQSGDKNGTGFNSDSHTIETTTPPIDIVTPDVQGSEGCKLSPWSRWSPCSATCGRGIRMKTRHVLSPPRNGGECNKKMLKQRPCSKIRCDTYEINHSNGGDSLEPDWGEPKPPKEGDCIMGPWSKWSPCSATCGVSSSRMRWRHVERYGKDCGERTQTRSCNLLPCKN